MVVTESRREQPGETIAELPCSSSHSLLDVVSCLPMERGKIIISVFTFNLAGKAVNVKNVGAIFTYKLHFEYSCMPRDASW